LFNAGGEMKYELYRPKSYKKPVENEIKLLSNKVDYLIKQLNIIVRRVGRL
tara:strand:+ start:28 stop:180 length:153 start_codon:yes stop_codon:yes gene_type:complete